MGHLRKMIFLCSWAAIVLLLPTALAISQEMTGKVIDENGFDLTAVEALGGSRMNE